MGGLNFSETNWPEMMEATISTLKMLGISGIFTIILGLPLGIMLYLWGRSDQTFLKAVYSVISLVVNILRSIPFIILIVVLMPVSKAIVGTTIGVLGTIPAFVIAATPFFAGL
jgi:D-methionine transport system permease protein